MAKKSKGKPATEIELSMLQDMYLADHDTAVWNRMFEIMVQYARSFVLKLTKGRTFLDPDHVLSVATESAIKIMQRYKKDETFKIEHSFGGLLQWKVRESLYGTKEEDIHLSLNQIISSEGGQATELGDILKGENTIGGFDPTYEQKMEMFSKADLLHVITEILKDFDEAVDSYRLWLLGRAYLLLLLRKPKKQVSLETFKNNLDLTAREQEVLDLLLLEIKQRVSTL